MPSVSMFPGTTQTERIPCRLHSRASPAARFSTRGAERGRVGEAGDPAPRREAEEDDQPARARDHRAVGDLAGQLPDGVEVEAADRPQPLRAHLLGRRGELTAGVVDEDVNGAEALQGRVEQGGDLPGLAQVARKGEAFRTVALQLLADRLERLDPAAADRHPGAGGGEGARRRPADPGAAAADQGDPAPVGVRRQGGRHSPRQTGSRSSAKARGPSSASAEAMARS